MFPFKKNSYMYDRKQFDFQVAFDNLLLVSCKPISSKFDKTRYIVIFESGTKYYSAAMACMTDKPDWVYLNWLGDFCKKYNGETIKRF